MQVIQRTESQRDTIYWCLVGLALVLRFVWMGDARFFWDEATFMGMALQHNIDGEWAQYALKGTRGVVYGPFAIWIFQIYLKIGSLFGAGVLFYFYLSALIHSATWLLGMIWLKKLFHWMPVWMIAAAALSPFFFHYSRMLWDNPFLIELTLLLFCSGWSFVQAPKVWKIALAAFLAAASFLIHLMAIPMIASMGIFMVWKQKSWILKNALVVMAILLGMAAWTYPYVSILLQSLASSDTQGVGFGAWNTKFLEGIFVGFAVISHLGGAYFLGNEAPLWITMLAHLCAITGIVFGAFFLTGLGKALLLGKSVEDSDRPLISFFRIYWIVLLIFAYATKMGGHPHYFNGTWVGFFLLTAWSLQKFLKSPKVEFKMVIMVLALAMTGILNQLFYHHFNHGSRAKHQGVTIENQLQIAEELIEKSIPTSGVSFQDAKFSYLTRNFEFLTTYLKFTGRDAELMKDSDTQTQQNARLVWADDEQKGAKKTGRIKLVY